MEAGAKANHLSYMATRPLPPGPMSARYHHLQLRRRRQAPHRDRQECFHRLELGVGRAGERSRRRPMSARARSSPRMSCGRAGGGARAAVVREGWLRACASAWPPRRKAKKNSYLGQKR